MTDHDLASQRDRLERLLAMGEAALREHNAARFELLAQGCGRSIVLCGSAAVGRYTLARLRRCGIEPRAFADNDQARWGTRIDGLEVRPVTDCVSAFNDDSIFVSTLYNGAGLRRQLRALGCRRVVPFPHLFWRYPEEFLPHFALGLPDTFFAERDAVLRALELYADPASRKQYVDQLFRRLLLNEEDAAPPRPPAEMYFPPGVHAPRPREVFVDCGAFDGDTLRAVLERGLPLERFYALEPDPGNFAKLSAFAEALPAEVRSKLQLHRCAVGAERGTLRFDARGDTASELSPEGDTEVDCIRLDDLLGDTTPTYIKIDIEGGETSALAGAAGSVARARPFLAVSVEHRLDDLWRHPLQIASIAGDYAFYLERYSEEYLELACYAVPKQR